MSEKQRANFRKAVTISIIIVIVDIIFLTVGISGKIGSMLSVGGVGIVTFFGMLMLTNLLSRTRYLDKGEIRKSLTASIMTVYFSLIVVHTDKIVSDTIIEHFTYVVGIVIAFYFGSRAIEAARKIPKGDSKDQLDDVIEIKKNDANELKNKFCIITADKENKNNDQVSFSEETPLARESGIKWSKSPVTYALIKGTEDIRGNSDSTEKTAMSLAMRTWEFEIEQKLKLVKKDENPDITINFMHSNEDKYLTKRKREGNNILGYAFRPGQDLEGTVVINDDYRWSVSGKSIEAWKVDPENYSPESTTTFTTWNLTSTLIHELGHTLGMPHIEDCPECIMHTDDNSNLDLHDKDIEIIRAKYGKTTRNDSEYKRLKDWLKIRVRRE